MDEQQVVENKEVKFGVVLLKDWMPNPFNGHSVNMVAGALTLITAKENFGFQPKGNETNWGVRVSDGERTILILGCQIRGIYWGQELPMNSALNSTMDLRIRPTN